MQIPENSDWVFDLKTLTLEFKKNGYWIPLADCTSSAQILDWIFQIRGKRWATEKVLSDLVQAFQILFRPQENFCSGGFERTDKPNVQTIILESLKFQEWCNSKPMQNLERLAEQP